MKNLLKNLIISWLFTTGLMLVPSSAKTEIVHGNSILCSNQGWDTEIALSTDRFNVAICHDNNYYRENNNGFHYIGQNKRTNEKVILSATSVDINAYPNTDQLFRAVNGSYTYQVYLKCDLDEWATISVFHNGEKIYHQRLNSVMTG
jgi:type IV secretory pathway VirB9-like protein